MSMNFETYRKNTEQSFQSLQSTLEGSPRSESETGPTPTSIDLASALGDTPSTSASCTTSLRPAPVNVTLPILPHPVNCHSEMLLATNPQFSPVSCGARTAPATSPQSSPIGAPSFKLDGYGGPISPISPMSDGRGSKSKDKQRSRPEPKSSGETTTLMIRNLPSHLTQTELLNELNKLGLSKLYDFCYLPRDFNVAENKGYAFVNFVSPETAHMFRKSFATGFLAGQQPVIADALIQGLEANLRKWCGPRLSRIRNPDLKPFVAAEALESGSTDRTVASTQSQVKVAMQNGDFVLQKARAMMPAVDLQPNTPTPVRH